MLNTPDVTDLEKYLKEQKKVDYCKESAQKIRDAARTKCPVHMSIIPRTAGGFALQISVSGKKVFHSDDYSSFMHRALTDLLPELLERTAELHQAYLDESDMKNQAEQQANTLRQVLNRFFPGEVAPENPANNITPVDDDVHIPF